MRAIAHIMEEVLSRRVTPLLKCTTLLLFTANFFTATVLTSRPQDNDNRNNIGYGSSLQQSKPLHYIRTFTKYHHRRMIQRNQNGLQDVNWPLSSEHQKVGKRSSQMNFPEEFDWSTAKKVAKRTVDVNSAEYITKEVSNLNQFTPNSHKDNNFDEKPKTKEKPKYIVKAAKIYTEPQTTMGPRISCLYQINNVTMGPTPAYDDESNAQLIAESKIFDFPGEISTTTLNGETVQVELCNDPRATCYTLWHQDSSNITVLGQGCWSSSRSCDRCSRVTARLPATKFCCCTKSYCNADFMSLQDEIITPKAESTVDQVSEINHSNIIASAMLGIVAILVLGVVCRKLYCKPSQQDKDEISEGVDIEKGDVMGSGPDSLATGLLCVDNLTLIEHIGQGKFGSVWRGSLGSNPVAVKLYSNASAWQKEAAIYALPHMAHPNILKYYGSETRPTLMENGTREQLLVLELCSMTLRQRLQAQPLSWTQFANLAHGIASAVAHLHTQNGNKPCVVHRDINSNNVLIATDGSARLADLGLAQVLHPRREHSAPSRITEAGTLRYLAPEALEGALDLSGARCALCAVDVFALGLVLWEMLWRTNGAHIASTPPYHLPYQNHGLSSNPTLAQMQSLVSRNKARPPLPKGPVPESRVLKIATDTCDECWDHDAEARLTAVCVEERMAELKQMLHTHGPIIHDNIHPHQPDVIVPSPLEPEKNSNCLSTQTCDVTTPLLYPHPHIGRNACIERNTHTQTNTLTLIHKSLKDIASPTVNQTDLEQNCLSVARVNPSTRIIPQENSAFNEIRSYQRPLDYVQNDVSSHEERGPKQTNLLHDTKVEKPKWGIRRFFDRFKSSKMETEVKLVPEIQNGRTTTTIVEKPTNYDRPSNLVLNEARYNFEVPCLSPPNRTLSPTMMMESELNRENKVFGFKELSRDDGPRNQIFAVIVPKVNATDYIRSKDSNSSDSMNKSAKTSMSSQSIFKFGNSESEDSNFKKRLSIDNRIISNPSNSGRSSRASINLELQFMDSNHTDSYNISPFDLNTDCSSSEDEHLMLLSEGSKITMQTIPKVEDKKKLENEVLKESSQGKPDFGFNKFQNKYSNFDNEFSDPNDKENLVNGYSGDNPVYLAALNGEIDTDLKLIAPDINAEKAKSPKPSLKNLTIKRQHSLEQVSEIFSSSSDIRLQNPAGRVKTPGDLPVAVRRARRDRALQKGRPSECNRLSLYDDRMMFGNSL